MTVPRNLLTGPPHRYYVTLSTARDLPLLEDCHDILRSLIPRWIKGMQATAWMVAIEPSRLHLVLRHRTTPLGLPSQWVQAYQTWQPKSRLQSDAIAERITSLGGCLQLFSRAVSQAINQQSSTTGSCWEPRFRSCLLTDDTALIATCVMLLRKATPQRTWHHLNQDQLSLTPLPLTRLHSGQVIPTDQAPLGSPATQYDQKLITDLWQEISDSDPESWEKALAKSHALGLPESLAEALGRLERQPGRGRRRRMHDLGDSWGLAGIWG